MLPPTGIALSAPRCPKVTLSAAREDEYPHLLRALHTSCWDTDVGAERGERNPTHRLLLTLLTPLSPFNPDVSHPLFPSLAVTLLIFSVCRDTRRRAVCVQSTVCARVRVHACVRASPQPSRATWTRSGESSRRAWVFVQCRTITKEIL